MSKIQMLQLLITQRLSAAAEEIFGVFGRTIAEYEEEISRSKLEIDRQRRLLDLRRTPRVAVQRSGGAPTEAQDWSFGVSDLDQAKPPQIKEEDDELQELGELWSTQQEELHTRETEDPRPGTSVVDEDLSSARPHLDSYTCTVCGHAFAERGRWAEHVQVHRKVPSKADKSYTCDICGKRLTRFDGYQKHLRVHTGEKPYRCSRCGRSFSDSSNYKRHVRTHGGPEPQS